MSSLKDLGSFFKYKDGNLLHPSATPESDPSRCCFRYPTMMALPTSGWPCIPWRMYATWRGRYAVKFPREMDAEVKKIPPKEVVNKKGCILPRDGLYSFGVGLSPSPKSGEILVIRTRGFESWVMILGWIYGISIYLKELIEPISIQNLGCTNCCWNVVRNQQSNGTVVLTGYNQPVIQWFNCAKDREYSLLSLVIFWDLGSTMLRVS